jgi:hypothetical protein
MMEIPRITPEEVRRRMDGGEKVHFLDARGEDAWAGSDQKLPGAQRVPAQNAERYVDNTFSGNAMLVAYCT